VSAFNHEGMTGDIRTLLAEACELDVTAREKRRQAGARLAVLREETPPMEWHETLSGLGLDVRSAELLIAMSVGMIAA
jgi:hypothetical protein